MEDLTVTIVICSWLLFVVAAILIGMKINQVIELLEKIE